MFQVAAVAFGFAGVAGLTAVMDELMGKGDPAVLGKDTHQLLLDFLRRVAFGHREAAGDAEDVCVDHYAFSFAEADAENDVGGFAGGAGNCDQFSQGLRDLAFEVSDYLAGCSLDRFGLVMKEPCRPDEGFELGERCLRHRGRGGEALEQLWSYHVDADVRALGGEDSRDQQFPRGAMGQCAFDIRIGFVEGFENGGDAAGGEVAAWREVLS